VSAHTATVVGYDPTRDLSYRRAKLARDVVDWLAWLELGDAASRTLDQYQRDLARLCLLYPNKTIGEITDGDLLHLARRFHRGERRVRMAAVRSFFKWAKQQRRIRDNPCDYLPAIKQRPQKVIDVFSEAEVDALLSLDVVDAAPLAVLFEAGLRKAEARHLKFRHCSPEAGQVVVIDGKGGRDRIVPMSGRLRALMADLALYDALRPTDHVFYAVRANEVSSRRTRHQPVGEGTFARWWARCIDQAGVRYRTPHTARHTFATRWRLRGLSLDELQLVLGHASVATTSDLYVHTKVQDVAEHMALIEAGQA
jgi:integrase/recombinase XerD